MKQLKLKISALVSLGLVCAGAASQAALQTRTQLEQSIGSLQAKAPSLIQNLINQDIEHLLVPGPNGSKTHCAELNAKEMDAFGNSMIQSALELAAATGIARSIDLEYLDQNQIDFRVAGPFGPQAPNRDQEIQFQISLDDLKAKHRIFLCNGPTLFSSFTGVRGDTQYLITPTTDVVSFILSVTHEFVMAHDARTQIPQLLYRKNRVSPDSDEGRRILLSWRLLRAFAIEERALSLLVPADSDWYTVPLYQALKSFREEEIVARKGERCLMAYRELLGDWSQFRSDWLALGKPDTFSMDPSLSKTALEYLSEDSGRACIWEAASDLTDFHLPGGGPRPELKGGKLIEADEGKLGKFEFDFKLDSSKLKLKKLPKKKENEKGSEPNESKTR